MVVSVGRGRVSDMLSLGAHVLHLCPCAKAVLLEVLLLQHALLCALCGVLCNVLG